MKKLRRRARKSRKITDIERFVRDQLKRYIEIHREHEKDLTYIG